MQIMKRKYFASLIFLSMLLLSACATEQQHNSIYANAPAFSVLSPDIINNTIFAQAPTQHVKTLTYESTELATTNKFSRYQINLVNNNAHLTRYWTREVAPNNTHFILEKATPIIRGEGVGYGGIFMLAYEKWHALAGLPIDKNDYYKKYLMTSISNEQGKLFPLAVGNQLSFNYTDISKNKHSRYNLADQADAGKMVYQVISHQDGYRNGATFVPGDIYIIRVSKTTKINPKLMTQYEYYFSTHLGWYIMARYFKDNQPVAIYKLINWK